MMQGGKHADLISMPVQGGEEVYADEVVATVTNKSLLADTLVTLAKAVLRTLRIWHSKPLTLVTSGFSSRRDPSESVVKSCLPLTANCTPTLLYALSSPLLMIAACVLVRKRNRPVHLLLPESLREDIQPPLLE